LENESEKVFVENVNKWFCNKIGNQEELISILKDLQMDVKTYGE